MHRNGWMPYLRESQIRKQPKVVVKLHQAGWMPAICEERAKGNCQGEKDGSSWMDASYMQILNKETIKSG